MYMRITSASVHSTPRLAMSASTRVSYPRPMTRVNSGAPLTTTARLVMPLPMFTSATASAPMDAPWSTKATRGPMARTSAKA